MDGITDSRPTEPQNSEPWFLAMDPIDLSEVCKNDLETWSIEKKKEQYLKVHYDNAPFPMTDTIPLSPEKRIRDSICIHKERLSKGYRHVHLVPGIISKLTRFNSTSLESTAPSTKQLSHELKAYRQKLDDKHTDLTCEKLLTLKKELTATVEIVQQKLRAQETTSEEAISPSSKHSLSSRASNLSKKAAKKVSRSLRDSLLGTASEHGNDLHRPKVISRASWTSTTSKLAEKFHKLVEKRHSLKAHSSKEHSPKDSIDSTAADQEVTPESAMIFNPVIWNPSPGRKPASLRSILKSPSTSSLKPALKRRSTTSSPPSPTSKPRFSIGYTQDEPFERREWVPSENTSPRHSMIYDGPSGCQKTEKGHAEYHSEHSGWAVRRMSTESTSSQDERPLGWDRRKVSAATSTSKYSRSVSG